MNKYTLNLSNCQIPTGDPNRCLYPQPEGPASAVARVEVDKFLYLKKSLVDSPRISAPGVCGSGTAPHTPGGDVRGSSEADSLLYLNSNNSTQIPKRDPLSVSDSALQTANLLTNYHRKQAFTLASNVDRLFNLAPSKNHVGFLTLTFAENLTDFKEASKRFDSLNNHLLKKNINFGIWLRSTERQTRGAIHYHLVIETKEDIRTGFDWNLYFLSIEAKKAGLPYRALERKAFATANPYLRSLWKILRESMEKYGFGRSELLPIRSNAEAMSFYVGKYISKHIGVRQKRDLGMRLIIYSHGWTKSSVKISWYSENSTKWRNNVQKFVAFYIGSTGNVTEDHYRLTQKLGKRWAWHYRDTIIDIDFIIREENFQIPF